MADISSNSDRRLPAKISAGRDDAKVYLVDGGIASMAAAARGIIDASICIPCMMPLITSQFLRREAGDRPPVVPKGSKNLAFIGQFCEQPDDVVFTVEYSIRSAQAATYALLGLKREPPAVYKGKFDPRVLYEAFVALHDSAAA
jgi:oleate hydratase